MDEASTPSRIPKPDPELWNYVAEAKLYEAVALSCDLEPKELPYSRIDDDHWCDTPVEFRRRLGIAQSHISAGMLRAEALSFERSDLHRVNLAAFREWCRQFPWELPKSWGGSNKKDTFSSSEWITLGEAAGVVRGEPELWGFLNERANQSDIRMVTDAGPTDDGRAARGLSPLPENCYWPKVSGDFSRSSGIPAAVLFAGTALQATFAPDAMIEIRIKADGLRKWKDRKNIPSDIKPIPGPESELSDKREQFIAWVMAYREQFGTYPPVNNDKQGREGRHAWAKRNGVVRRFVDRWAVEGNLKNPPGAPTRRAKSIQQNEPN